MAGFYVEFTMDEEVGIKNERVDDHTKFTKSSLKMSKP